MPESSKLIWHIGGFVGFLRLFVSLLTQLFFSLWSQKTHRQLKNCSREYIHKYNKLEDRQLITGWTTCLGFWIFLDNCREGEIQKAIEPWGPEGPWQLDSAEERIFSLGMGILGRAQKSRSTGSSKETFLKEFFSAQTLKRQHKLWNRFLVDCLDLLFIEDFFSPLVK